MLLWRLCKARYAASAFSGEGARLFGGRWNPQGVRMVYTSPSLALAAMEYLVNLDPSMEPNDLVALSARLPEDVRVIEFALDQLPEGWREMDRPPLQEKGARWIAQRETVGLRVPSAAVRGDWNILLNPEHPDFSRITFGAAEPWSFDPRVLRRRS